jgi:hypothetical protein
VPVQKLFFWNLWIYRHSVGLLGRGIGPTQGLYLHRTTQHRKTRTNIHASSGYRTHDLSGRAAEDSTCLRPHSHWDRLIHNLFHIISCRKPRLEKRLLAQIVGNIKILFSHQISLETFGFELTNFRQKHRWKDRINTVLNTSVVIRGWWLSMNLKGLGGWWSWPLSR